MKYLKLMAMTAIVMFYSCINAVKTNTTTKSINNEINGDSTQQYLYFRIEKAHQSNNNRELANSYTSLGQYFYDINGDSCRVYLEKAAATYEKLGNKPKQAICLQNIAFALMERKQPPQSEAALNYATRAYKIWKTLQDTVNEANIQKYMGYLYGENHDFKTGLANINEAKLKFEKLRNEAGAAVCLFDKALVLQKMNQPDSAVFYANQAKLFWQQKNNQDTIFNINNLITKINLSFRTKNSVMQGLIAENESILAQNQGIYWEDKHYFFQNAIFYYKMVGLRQKARWYQKQQKKLRQSPSSYK